MQVDKLLTFFFPDDGFWSRKSMNEPHASRRMKKVHGRVCIWHMRAIYSLNRHKIQKIISQKTFKWYCLYVYPSLYNNLILPACTWIIDGDWANSTSERCLHYVAINWIYFLTIPCVFQMATPKRAKQIVISCHRFAKHEVILHENSIHASFLYHSRFQMCVLTKLMTLCCHMLASSSFHSHVQASISFKFNLCSRIEWNRFFLDCKSSLIFPVKMIIFTSYSKKKWLGWADFKLMRYIIL